MKTQRGANRTTREIDDKDRLENSLSPLRHFTEHLAGVLGKLPRENDLDHESSRLSIRWLNSTPGIQPASIMTTPIAIDKQNRNSTTELKTGNQERVVFLLRRRTRSTRRKTAPVLCWENCRWREPDPTDNLSGCRRKGPKCREKNLH
jgi:hypothetical protein